MLIAAFLVKQTHLSNPGKFNDIKESIINFQLMFGELLFGHKASF